MFGEGAEVQSAERCKPASFQNNSRILTKEYQKAISYCYYPRALDQCPALLDNSTKLRKMPSTLSHLQSKVAMLS